MKEFSIFVEGDGDKKFIEDIIQYLKDENIINLPDNDFKEKISETKGWTTLKSNQGQSHRNKMKQTMLRGGVNLVIFDADSDIETRRQELIDLKKQYDLDFEIFLFPNDKDPGAIEELLEKIINPANQCVLDCWKNYENELSQQIIEWKKPKQPTTPSSKSKIYAYLEALVGNTHSEKKRIKDPNRDFCNKNFWNLETLYIKPLRDFLIQHIG